MGSTAVVCTFLKEYSAVYLALGIVLAFVVSFHSNSESNLDHRIGSGIFYSLTNVTILAKCPLADRGENYPQMKAVSICWLTLHTATLVGLIIWFGAIDSATHLAHWSEHRFTFCKNPALFFATTSSLILLGPISVFFLWRLEKQVKTLEEKEGNVYWSLYSE